MSDQLGMFDVPAVSAPQSSRATPPARERRRASSATPERAQDVMAEIKHGRYGLLDDTDRVVVFEDTDRVRVALDEEIVHSLMAQGYAEACPRRDIVSCLHGVVRKPVTPIRLTRRGTSTLSHWSALKAFRK